MSRRLAGIALACGLGLGGLAGCGSKPKHVMTVTIKNVASSSSGPGKTTISTQTITQP